MIIQCDQCNTKFRLDDAKVPDKGVKVRCAKCKSIFLVQKEAPAEEPDFDSLLSGLGAQAAEGESGIPEQAGAPSPEGDWGDRVSAAPPESWEKEPEETPAESAGQHAGRDDFGEDFFSFREESPAAEEEGSERGEYQFGETAAGPEGGGVPTEEAEVEKREFDFGEFTPGGEESATEAAPSEPAAASVSETGEFDFGSFDIGPEDSPLAAEGGASQGTAEGPGTEGFTSGEEEPPTAQEVEELKWSEPEGEGAGEFVFSTAPVPEKEEQVEEATVPGEGMAPAGPVGADTLETGAAAEAEVAIAGESAPEPEWAPAALKPAAGIEPAVQFDSPLPAADEELPPLAISSRKKGSSVFSVAVTAVAVLIVVAVAGVGFYFFKEGPAAFDKLGLSFLARWIGIESVAVGNIAVRNQQGAFMVNGKAGEIFVVSGEVVNNYSEPRSSIQVKATVLGPKGEALMQKTAYCGVLLSREQLTTLSMEKIEEAMGSQFGDTLDNFGVPPGKVIPFVIVFSKVPKEASEFSVEVAGSTAAAQ